MDYEPIDLSRWCNTNASCLGTDVDTAIGHQKYRGLPFQIGASGCNGDDKCLILMDGLTNKLEIPVGSTAQSIIFAHRLMETKIHLGGPQGTDVAEYVLHYTDGSEYATKVRERFEIAMVPVPDIPGKPATSAVAVLGLPYRAIPDEKASLYPLTGGEWGLTGWRQTEAVRGVPRHYYLWSMKNPYPDRVVQSVNILPKGPAFVVAAITLNNLTEHPFTRQGRRPVIINRIEGEDNDYLAPLELDVDRGDTTYVHTLPKSTQDEFLVDSHLGYGEGRNVNSSPAYAEISAVPSATLKVSQGEQDLGEFNWDEVQKNGFAGTDHVRVKLVDPGKNWVRVTVLDDDTGRPVHCRVHFRSSEGIPFQPHGHHNQINSNLDTWHIDVGGDVRLGQITYAYIDGKCQGWLPRGEVIVDVARGFEYDPIRSRVRIEPGQQELTLRLKRWTNMNAQGWYSGDSHVHFLSTNGSHIESQGEDLNVVNLLQSQWGSLFTNTEEFTGSPSLSRVGDNIVYVSQENRQHFMGHIILWGLREPIMPWCSDGPAEAEIGGSMETTLSHWADDAHGQGGYVISPHFPNPNGEPPALVATGRLDGVEMLRQVQFIHDEYYRYLSSGYRLPLVGGTDKMTSDVPVGLYRTYVKLREGEEFTYDNWCKNVVRGRTFLSGGPIIHLSVNGQEIGDTIQLSSPGTVEIEAWAESVIPINTLQVIQSGKVVASTDLHTAGRRLEIREKLYVEGHTWISARCGGPNYFGTTHHDEWQRGVFAHTSPIYISCGGDWEMYDEETLKYMLTLIEGDLMYIKESSSQHPVDMVTHHHGEKDHMAYLQRPFLEAQAAIHKRMHQHRISH